jgi:hypothetical protein
MDQAALPLHTQGVLPQASTYSPQAARSPPNDIDNDEACEAWRWEVLMARHNQSSCGMWDRQCLIIHTNGLTGCVQTSANLPRSCDCLSITHRPQRGKTAVAVDIAHFLSSRIRRPPSRCVDFVAVSIDLIHAKLACLYLWLKVPLSCASRRPAASASGQPHFGTTVTSSCQVDLHHRDRVSRSLRRMLRL